MTNVTLTVQKLFYSSTTPGYSTGWAKLQHKHNFLGRQTKLSNSLSVSNWMTSTEEMAPQQPQEPLQPGAPDYLNKYDYLSFEQDKFINAGHGGKQRNKREVVVNQSRRDPCGNVRVVTQRMQNFEQKRKNMNLAKSH